MGKKQNTKEVRYPARAMICLSNETKRRAKKYGVNISLVCRQALERAVSRLSE